MVARWRKTWLGAALCAAAGTSLLFADESCSTLGCGPGTCGAEWEGFETLITSADYPGDPGDSSRPDTPVAFVDPGDGSDRRLVATQQGVVWLWRGVDRQVSPIPFLDLRDRVATGGERGLLALAVDPAYAATGELYVFYTAQNDGTVGLGDIVVERFLRSAEDPETADPASATRILAVTHPDNNHNGGSIAFGPDGMLYVSIGDGGGHCDDDIDENPRTPNGQNLGTLLGKILRLDVRDVDPGAGAPECDAVAGGYRVPLGNPFAGGTAGCGEIWAYGLRNPFRFTFDRETGDLWIGDVGQGAWEEIDFLPASYYPLAPDGAVNFGWRCREGCETLTCPPGDCPEFLVDTGAPTTCLQAGDVDPGIGVTPYWDPVLCHRNGGGAAGARWQAIVGGYRYRGARVPALADRYLYSDTYCDQIWATTSIDEGDPAATTSTCLHALADGSYVYSFAEDHLGELYLIRGVSGAVQCLHAGDGCYWAGWGGLFEDGFEADGIGRWTASFDEP